MKAERQRLGWSQQVLGVRARVQCAEISKIENGRLIPYAGQRKRLAKALGLTPDELLQPVESSRS
jgi:transcriptional regulator with XRE-family HTH domain